MASKLDLFLFFVLLLWIPCAQLTFAIHYRIYSYRQTYNDIHLLCQETAKRIKAEFSESIHLNAQMMKDLIRLKRSFLVIQTLT